MNKKFLLHVKKKFKNREFWDWLCPGWRFAYLWFSCFLPTYQDGSLNSKHYILGRQCSSQEGRQFLFIFLKKSKYKIFPKGPLADFSLVPLANTELKDHILASGKTGKVNIWHCLSLNCEAGSSRKEVNWEGNQHKETNTRVSHICLLKYISTSFKFQFKCPLHEALPNLWPDRSLFSLNAYGIFV